MASEKSWISVRSADLSAEIDPLGAQLSVLRDRKGNDLLWNGDPTVWAGRAPLLFPIVGVLAGGSFRWRGSRYPLPRHGFARGSAFETVEAAPTTATFRLQADDNTLKVYPFRFELDMQFAVYGATLSMTATLRNAGEETMPASFGYHPALRWPLPYGRPRSSHFIEFVHAEPAAIRRLNPNGLLTPARHPTPVSNQRLALKDSLFRDDVVIFDDVRSRSVIYGAAEAPRIRVSYPDADYLGVWSKPGAGFVCIEPWNGISDPEGFSGEFDTKPGVFSIAPGAVRTIRMAVTLLAG